MKIEEFGTENKKTIIFWHGASDEYCNKVNRCIPWFSKSVL